jgi:hypothetical protein
MPCPFQHLWFDHRNYTWRRVQVQWSSSLCSFLQPPVTSSLSVQIFSLAPSWQAIMKIEISILLPRKAEHFWGSWAGVGF